MSLKWGTRRKFLYIIVVAFLVMCVLIVSYQFFFTAPPTCFDGIKNGNERGVDCGGSCALICTADAHAPIVLWSRAFQVANGSYTAAAYVQNTNINAGAKQVHYTFQLFDDKNLLVTERSGVIDLPPVQTIPIVETGINVGQRIATKTFFSFSQAPVWYTIPQNMLPALSINNEVLASDGTRLSATITNNSLTDARDITAIAVVFDSNGVAVTASKSLVRLVSRKSSQTIVFTWPNSLPDVSRAEVTLLPTF